MAKLSVNVNKIATLRNARGKNLPNLLHMSQDILRYGCHGLTVHPRPDERHIRRSDVYELSNLVREQNLKRSENNKYEFNIEGYPSHEFIAMIEEVNPDQCTLVPDPPTALTSNAGWAIADNIKLLEWAIGRLHERGVRSSLFIDVFKMTNQEMDALLAVKPDRVELYTEAYAENYFTPKREEITETYRNVAIQIYDLGIAINAGHDLNLDNIEFLIDQVPFIEEVSIGHALFCEALYKGVEPVMKDYLKRLNTKS